MLFLTAALLPFVGEARAKEKKRRNPRRLLNGLNADATSL